MNNQLVKCDIDTNIAEIEKMRKACDLLIKTPHYAKLGNEGVIAIYSKARSLNMDPIYALNGGLYYVQGKVGMPAESMAALIREKGHSIVKDSKSNDQVCILHGKRLDNGDTWSITFTAEDAKRAGLWKQNYDKYPSAMLYNRAMSFLARQLFPDIIKGAGYTMDELQEIAAPSFSEEKTTETVSEEQVQELCEILKECDPKYVESVHATLKKPPMNIDSFEKLPVNLFDRIRNAALRNRETFLSSLQVEQAEMFEEVAND